jgi:hypothetical protein
LYLVSMEKVCLVEREGVGELESGRLREGWMCIVRKLGS